MSNDPAAASEDVTEKACDFLMGVLDRMGIAADIDVKEEDDKIVLEIQTANPDVVIGRKGQVVDALQHLVGKVVFRERSGEKGKPFVVDAGGYRDKHIERLKALAAKMGEKARETRTIVELSPMSAHDRRIVHMEIATMPGLSSRSEGEGDDRHILVVPGDDAPAAVAE
ncbi:MAG: KH domain-containing protein [Kofleriaceae bacterium]|nr:KH domain-containing protein [Myxococcales bacterium]MCB9559491.1 KH domain-containing protein [Kofleriaceae bacterium]